MQITRADEMGASEGPADYFTGRVRMEGRFAAPAPARLRGVTVTFEPGARTAWHTHPLGQTLIVTAGTGWAQIAGGQRHTIRAGDRVWFEPGEKHWHGATTDTEMTHIALQEADETGENVTWMEHVTDADYLSGS